VSIYDNKKQATVQLCTYVWKNTVDCQRCKEVYTYYNSPHLITIELLKRHHLDGTDARRNASAYWLKIVTRCMGKWYIKRWFNDDGHLSMFVNCPQFYACITILFCINYATFLSHVS
jgi:hypothetical protein